MSQKKGHKIVTEKHKTSRKGRATIITRHKRLRKGHSIIAKRHKTFTETKTRQGHKIVTNTISFILTVLLTRRAGGLVQICAQWPVVT